MDFFYKALRTPSMFASQPVPENLHLWGGCTLQRLERMIQITVYFMESFSQIYKSKCPSMTLHFIARNWGRNFLIEELFQYTSCSLIDIIFLVPSSPKERDLENNRL